MNARGHECHIGLLHIAEGNCAVRVRKPLYRQEGLASGHQMMVFKLPMHALNIAAVDILRQKKIKIVVDIDDWFDGLPKENHAWKQTDPETNKENNRNIYFQIIEMADALICSTPFLYDFYAKKHPGKPIFMVRNSIDTVRWPKPKIRRSVPVIGWVGATPWRSNDLEQLAPFMNDYLKSRHVSFHHSGHMNAAHAIPASKALSIDESLASTSPMVSMLDLPSLYENIDIGIVPLNDVPFNYAKSYLKGLEYAIAGKPFISSLTPEYKYLADAGIGRVATSEKEWVAHLDELMDFSIRNDESVLNHELVVEHFSIDSQADAWEETYLNIMDIA